jgi:hypothetical protein
MRYLIKRADVPAIRIDLGNYARLRTERATEA